MRRLIKEITIFISIFMILGLGMHMDKWLSTPIEHFEQLPNHVMPWHPLIYTVLFYFVLGAARVLIAGIGGFFKRS
jgi:hypothetical protein